MINKIFKTILILSICFSTVFSSYAAVSVSDGSAFITKAEFQADLSNISNRIAQAENSIDARIDSLVSQYLTRNGIWNGAKQNILNNLGTNAFTNERLKVLEDVNKTGLILVPYYVTIDYLVGIVGAGNTSGKSQSSIDAAMGSPVSYALNIDVGLYNESNNIAYQTRNLYYGLTGEYDTGNYTDYCLKLNQSPSGVFMFFISKGDSVYYKLQTSLNARMDWWAFTLVTPINGNEKTLSGKAIAMGSSAYYGNWITGSYYKIYFGIKGNQVSIY